MSSSVRLWATTPTWFVLLVYQVEQRVPRIGAAKLGDLPERQTHEAAVGVRLHVRQHQALPDPRQPPEPSAVHLAPDTAAHVGLAQSPEETLDAALAGPVRDEGGQARAGRGVRVDVRGRVDPLVARPVQNAHQLVRATVVARVDDRQVRVVDADAGATAHLEQFLHRLEVPAGPHPGVGGVEGAVVAFDRVRDGGYLPDLGVARRRVGQARGHPERALLDGLRGEPPHARELVRSRRPVVDRADRYPERVVTHERRDVDADAARLDALSPLVQRRPVPLDRSAEDRAERAAKDGRPRVAAGERRVGAVAGDLGSHPLVHLALPAGIVEHAHVRVAVGVDETRADHVARSVNPQRRFLPGELADRRDAAAGNTHVGALARPSRSVDDGAVHDQGVEVHRCLHRQVVGHTCRRRIFSHTAAVSS